MVVPFFAIKIPIKIIDAIGKFDEKFGVAGAEDYDYCLRAYLSGFECKFALSSYLFHFGGKSTWSGCEKFEAQVEREKYFKEYFIQKWGMALHDTILTEGSIDSSRFEQGTSPSKDQIKQMIEKLKAERSPDIKLW